MNHRHTLINIYISIHLSNICGLSNWLSPFTTSLCLTSTSSSSSVLFHTARKMLTFSIIIHHFSQYLIKIRSNIIELNFATVYLLMMYCVCFSNVISIRVLTMQVFVIVFVEIEIFFDSLMAFFRCHVDDSCHLMNDIQNSIESNFSRHYVKRKVDKNFI